MAKKIFYTLIPIIALGFILFSWWKIDQKQSVTITHEDFFSEEVLMIGEIHDLSDFLRGLRRSSSTVLQSIPSDDPVLKALSEHEGIGNEEEWTQFSRNLSLYFGCYLTADQTVFLWILPMEKGVGNFIAKVKDDFNSVNDEVLKMNEETGEIQVNQEKVFYHHQNNYLLLSVNKEIVDHALKQLEDAPKKSVFSQLKTSEFAELNLKINLNKWTSWLEENSRTTDDSEVIREWLNFNFLDIHFKNKGLYLSTVSDGGHWSKLKMSLTPTIPEQIKILPESTRQFCWMNFKNEGFFRAYNAIYNNEDNQIEHFDMLKWIDGEVTFFDAFSHSFMMVSSQFSSYDPELVIEELNAKSSGLHVDSVVFIDHSAFRIHRFYPEEAFSIYIPKYLRNNNVYKWYALIDDQILLSDSKEALMNFIDHFTAEKFMLDEQSIERFIVPNHGSQTSFLFQHSLQGLEDESAFGVWYKNHFSQQNFKFQWSYNPLEEGGIHHLTWMQPFSSDVAQNNDSSDVVWEKEIDYVPTGNYITYYDPANGNVMLVEGEDQFLHIIKSNGDEIKKVKLSGSLVGNPQFISANKGKEKVLMFNTSHDVYLTDLKGGLYQGFPYKSSNEISGTARIFDYENDGTLRIIVPLSNGEVKNINKKGKEVDGWVMQKVGEKFVSHPRHFIREGKDYMCFFTASQKLYAVDRRGELRPGFPFDFKGWTGGDVKLAPATKIADSYIRYISEEGKLKRVFFSGEQDVIDLTHDTKHYTWDFEDLTGDGNAEFIASRAGYITVYNDIGIEIFSYPAEVFNIHALQVIQKNKKENYLGYILKNKNQLILLDPFGELRKGYPIAASNLFFTMDVNGDNQRELVYFDKNMLICTQNW